MTDHMKRRRSITIAVVFAAVALFGCQALLQDRSDPKCEVQYGGPLADKNDVHEIRQIVSHERWAVLWRAIGHRDGRTIRDSARQLGFGRLRLIAGGSDFTGPSTQVYYDDRRNDRYWADYSLHYQNGHWTVYGYTYGDKMFYSGPVFHDQ
jgi:hypothetical protein